MCLIYLTTMWLNPNTASLLRGWNLSPRQLLQTLENCYSKISTNLLESFDANSYFILATMISFIHLELIRDTNQALHVMLLKLTLTKQNWNYRLSQLNLIGITWPKTSEMHCSLWITMTKLSSRKPTRVTLLSSWIKNNIFLKAYDNYTQNTMSKSQNLTFKL